MFLITREKVEALREKLGNPSELGRCTADVRKMLEIKEALLWRADVGPCCAGPGLASRLFAEVQLLRDTLQTLEEGDNSRASSLLAEFASGVEPT